MGVGMEIPVGNRRSMTLGGGGLGAELVDAPAPWTLDGQGEVVAFGEFFVAVGTADVVRLLFHVLQNLYKF